MAEDTDNTQKQKAPLIKPPQGRGENSPEKVKQEQNEKRRVVVVKKKPAPPAPAAEEPPAAKNNQIKPAAGGQAEKPARADAQNGSDKKEQAQGSPPPVTMDEKEKKRVQPAAASGKAQAGPPPASGATSGATSGAKPEAKTPFTFAQRPAVAAGRVGGKFVGKRPDEKPPADGFTPRHGGGGRGGHSGGSQGAGHQRPHGRQEHDSGRVGGSRLPAQGFNRPPQAGGFSPRPGGGPRPGFTPRPQTGGSPGGGRGPGAPAAAGTGAPQAAGVKRTFKAKKPTYNRKEKELEMEEKLLQTKKKITHVANPIPKSIEIMEVISVAELARKMNLKVSEIIQKLIGMGQMVTINQQIDAETAEILAAEFGTEVKIISLYEETLIETATDEGAEMLPRPPIVTVMGHVDHGKTKLLDAIRSADVTSGEFGGITQHIGAYMVETPGGSVTFLDTPGHEAFTRMRSRGAQVTDIVVLVVAADDGVMPQTIEALNHAKDADVPIIVAINKIDKPEANRDRVKAQLSDLGLMPEDWGGQTMYVELSALQKIGIDKLIEAILLQAEILDLKANYQRNAEGKILESKVDHGRGIVATLMVERGTLGIGDSFVAGIWPGKVRAIFNNKGEKIKKALPSMPVEIIGFEGLPNAGDPLQVVETEKLAREFSSKRQELKRFEDAKKIKKITMDNLNAMIRDGAIQELKVIIKADGQGSAEALRSSLEKLSTDEIRLHVILALPGPINEGDITLAMASNAIIIGYNVRPLPKAKLLAEQEKIDIRKHSIIYKAVEEISQAMEGMLKPDTKEEVIAHIDVRQVYHVSKVGTIAGCHVEKGSVKRSATVNVIRDGIVIHSGKIASLKRFKDDAREVTAGYDCGIGLEGFDDLKVGDHFEVIEIVEIARKLGDH